MSVQANFRAGWPSFRTKQAVLGAMLLVGSPSYAQLKQIQVPPNASENAGWSHSFRTDLPIFAFAIAVTAFLVGLYGERYRAKLARQAWQARRRRTGPRE